jgi:hypothetical protein
MQLLFQSTQEFEQELSALSESERSGIIETINGHCPNFVCDRESLFTLVHQPREIQLTNRCCSSLYVMPAGHDRAIILTLDEDPIFDQLIITLIRLVPTSECTEVYMDVARRLYEHRIADTAGEDKTHG